MSYHLRKNSNSFLNLADDVITHILSKLPVESLQRFKIVCKRWCSTIKDPKFIKSQIDESSSNINHQKILLISSKIAPSPCLEYNMLAFNIGSTYASSLSINSQVVSLQPPSFFMSQDVSYPSVSSCNGLLCMVYSFKIFLWNPVIGKYKIVDKPDHYVLKRVNCYESALYGFAYDSVTDDYKIAATFVIKAKNSRYIVGIYSVNSESWKKIRTIPAGYRLFDQNPVSLDGTINMMATRNDGSAFDKFAIISLLVSDEKFVVTPVPLQYCGNHMKLSNFANHLYLSVFVEMDFLVCSLEKEGEWWTWTNVMKIPTLGSLIGIGNHNCYLDDIICLKENGNILWRKTDGGFLEYNVQNEEVTEFTLNQIPPTTDVSILFTESFASLKVPWD
ncbi:F-box/kelch-repeat protein At3g23880-like [Lycium ferocissimum]|uniref:F-box/kelch-repeat protein At3g23880-like n=1 Tax=Lycium ferocissimum TaxID=112874 RepID=UPI002815DAC2|nr:F-box/kelch-repeat protein At3g23880-like [Lycium ferocissimum]